MPAPNWPRIATGVMFLAGLMEIACGGNLTQKAIREEAGDRFEVEDVLGKTYTGDDIRSLPSPNSVGDRDPEVATLDFEDYPVVIRVNTADIQSLERVGDKWRLSLVGRSAWTRSLELRPGGKDREIAVMNTPPATEPKAKFEMSKLKAIRRLGPCPTKHKCAEADHPEKPIRFSVEDLAGNLYPGSIVSPAGISMTTATAKLEILPATNLSSMERGGANDQWAVRLKGSPSVLNAEWAHSSGEIAIFPLTDDQESMRNKYLYSEREDRINDTAFFVPPAKIKAIRAATP